ncbi:MAG: hypothetical protein JWP97_6820 [Labilithrix sp.]|nr:hypothetical protein [Labilithrix sp.]
MRRCLSGPVGSTVLVLSVFIAAGCKGSEPPSVTGLDGSVAPLPPPPGASGSAEPQSARAGVTVAASSDTPDAGAAPVEVDPGTLPQTHDKPEASGAAFDARVAALWEAVQKDDPERGLPAFFPVTAYDQVKAIPNASSDWRHRLVSAYKRDIHALHKRLGDHAADAKLLRAEVPQDRARWVDPGEESNKLGYYRVYGTRIVYDDGSGKERSFDVSSLISWRGAWYVVHLTGFK